MGARAIEIGTAGEYLCCADLIINGYIAYPTMAGIPYDVVLDDDGELFKIAVKSCGKPAKRPEREGGRMCYSYAISRHLPKYKTNQTVIKYTDKQVDIVAMVGIDIKQVAYIPLEICPSMVFIGGERKFNKPYKYSFETLKIEDAISYVRRKREEVAYLRAPT